MIIPFTKMQGLGNDFVVFDATREPIVITPEQAAWISDRRFGIGCDQILLLEPAPSESVDFGYRILNSDGSESGQCGNGARCIAVFARDNGLIDKDILRVQTITGRMQLNMLPGGEIRVDMGVPVFTPAKIPFSADTRASRYVLQVDDYGAIEFGAVSMGNPHAVIQTENVDQAPVATLGPLVEAHPRFPERVNTGFMQVVSKNAIRLRVFERGAGETLACGSGACAAAVVGQMQGLLAEDVIVSLPGGDLRVEWAGEGEPVYMTGPATSVFRGEIDFSGVEQQ